MECMQQMGEASRGAGSGDNAAAALLEGAPLQAIAEFVSVRQGDVCCTADQPSCMQPEATKLVGVLPHSTVNSLGSCPCVVAWS